MKKDKKLLYLEDPSWIASNQKGEVSPGQSFMFEDFLGLGNAFIYLSMVLFPILILLPTVIVLRRQYTRFTDPFFLLVAGSFAAVTLITYMAWGRVLWKSRQIKNDLASSHIASSVGEVVVTWRGLKIFLQEKKKELRWIAGYYTINLAPGAYLFYYLSESLYVLSAQALSADNLGANLMAALQKSLKYHFSDQDLAQNQKGILSEAQKSFVRKEAIQDLAAALGWGLFITLFTGAVLVKAQNLSYGGMAMIALFGCGAFYYIYELMREALSLWTDQKQGVVSQVNGDLEKIWKPRLKTHSYYFKVNDLQFEVTQQAYNVVKEDQNYTLYYLPNSQKVMSLNF